MDATLPERRKEGRESDLDGCGQRRDSLCFCNRRGGQHSYKLENVWGQTHVLLDSKEESVKALAGHGAPSATAAGRTSAAARTESGGRRKRDKSKRFGLHGGLSPTRTIK